MSNRRQYRSRHSKKPKYQSRGTPTRLASQASGVIVYGEKVDKKESQAYWNKYRELAEEDTKLMVHMGIAGTLIDWMENTHIDQADSLPRETARFLIDRFTKEGEILTGLNITSYPYTYLDRPNTIGITKIVKKGTRLHLPQNGTESPLPNIISLEQLTVIHGIACQRPIETSPPVFTYPDNLVNPAA